MFLSNSTNNETINWWRNVFGNALQLFYLLKFFNIFQDSTSELVIPTTPSYTTTDMPGKMCEEVCYIRTQL